MADLDLIELLNDVELRYGNNDQVFLDKNGHPTDHFLLALQSLEDNGISPDEFASGNANTDYISNLGNSVNLEPLQPKNGYRESTRKRYMKSNPNFNHAESRCHSICSRTNKSKKKERRKEHISINRNIETYSSASSPFLSKPSHEFQPHLSRSVSEIDKVEIEINPHENDTKLKSLQLRVLGQLRAIKLLEKNLSSAMNQLDQKNELLQSAQKRILYLEIKEREKNSPLNAGRVKLQSKTSNDEYSQQLLKSQLDAMKSKLDLIHAKHIDEQSRRQKSDERCKLLKEYMEKAKERILTLESRNSDQQSIISDLSNKSLKIRREGREMSAEAAALAEALSIENTECGKLRLKLENAEALIKSTRHDNDVLREEVRSLKSNSISLHERLKQSQFEVNVYKEKDGARRAEQRLNDIKIPGGRQSSSVIDTNVFADRSSKWEDDDCQNVHIRIKTADRKHGLITNPTRSNGYFRTSAKFTSVPATSTANKSGIGVDRTYSARYNYESGRIGDSRAEHHASKIGEQPENRSSGDESPDCGHANDLVNSNPDTNVGLNQKQAINTVDGLLRLSAGFSSSITSGVNVVKRLGRNGRSKGALSLSPPRKEDTPRISRSAPSSPYSIPKSAPASSYRGGDMNVNERKNTNGILLSNRKNSDLPDKSIGLNFLDEYNTGISLSRPPLGRVAGLPVTSIQSETHGRSLSPSTAFSVMHSSKDQGRSMSIDLQSPTDSESIASEKSGDSILAEKARSLAGFTGRFHGLARMYEKVKGGL